LSHAYKARSRQSLLKRIVLVAALSIGTMSWMISWPRISPVAAQSGAGSFQTFEAPQIHPLTITPDGTRLLACNTHNNSLSVFQLTSGAPTLSVEIPTGLQPVSVAARNNGEAWVANWLSNTVSIIDLTSGTVTQTIDVGYQPTDVVFVGQPNQMALVCVAGMAQVQAYDPASPTTPPQIVSIAGKQPRSLTVDPATSRVFVSVFQSGNNTTVVPASDVTAAGGPPAPSIRMAKGLPPAPAASLIVKWNGSSWGDETGNTKWNQYIPYTLSDVDLVVLDASGPTVTTSVQVSGVGAHVGNAVLDQTGTQLYVANTDALNNVRFEPVLRGRFVSNLVSIVDFGGSAPTVTAVDINPQINFNVSAGSKKERNEGLALPADIVRGSDGTLYVAATGSAKVGVLSATGAVQGRIAVGNGPTGLAIDSTGQHLYVLNSFDGTISLVDLATQSVANTFSLGFNPEPAQVQRGRMFLYDARLSAHGNVACASCHPNGDRDLLAWDLGNPKGTVEAIPSNYFFPLLGPLQPSDGVFHPMKGPMTTQSLRGIIGTEPLHWRGDQPNFEAFNAAFVALLGGPRELTDSEMADYAAFIQTLTYPPNPFENPDRTYPDPPTGPSALRGFNLFTNSSLDLGVLTCNACHLASPGFGSGTDKLLIAGTILEQSQSMKVPQLRMQFEKVGMSRTAGVQLAGFGYEHDGNVDTLLDFLRVRLFTFTSDDQRNDVVAFIMAFDTGTAPSVGMQVTVRADNKTSSAVADRIHLLMAQADAGNCDLIVKGAYQGAQRGFLYKSGGMFQPDKQSEANVAWQALTEAASAGGELTFTGVPPGSGYRMGIDRVGDGTLDGDR
jgi:YVTN family beta-propeller protein